MSNGKQMRDWYLTFVLFCSVPHSSDAVRAGQLFANFFVDECRKNSHVFDAARTNDLPLIYNFTAEFTASSSSYEQTYFFDLK